MAPRYLVTGDIESGESAARLGRFLEANPGPVEVVINSPGGAAQEGAAMMASVQRHGEVTAILRGMCCSAATLPAVAAKKIVMHHACFFMIHEPARYNFWGTADALRQEAEVLEKLTHIYADAYSRETGNDIELVKAWMKAETYLTADEALELNFCDEIEGPEAGTVTVAAFDLSHFKSPPPELVRLAAENGWATASPSMEKANA